MTHCDECKERLYPTDPQIGFTDFRTKRYYAPLCQGCSYEHEAQEVKEIPEKPWDRRQWYTVEQLKGEILNLKRKFIALEEKTKGRGDKYAYK